MIPPTTGSFLRLMSVYALYNAVGLLMSGLFEAYSFGLGLNIPEIVLTSACLYATPLIFLVFMRRFEARRCILTGIGLAILAGLLLAFIPHPAVPFIARMILGATIFFFWLPFNVIYYEGAKKNNAFLGSLYYSVSPVLSLALPALAGWTAATFGYPALFLISVALLLANLAMAGAFIGQRKYAYDAIASLRSISGLRTLFFVEGFSIIAISQVTLSAMILTYFTDPQGFGGMLSAVTVFSVVASFITSLLSDRYGQRRIFLIAAASGFLLAALFTTFTSGLAMFFIGFGAISFFRGILLPLPLALAVDNSKSLVDTMVGREMMLNLGRTLAVLVGTTLILLFDIRAMLLVQAIAAALYIPLFEIKKRKLAAF